MADYDFDEIEKRWQRRWSEARTFEVVETRRLPSEQAPSFPEELHHFVAILPHGDGYYVLRLISARSDYLEHRDAFVRFLKTFRLLGTR